MNMLHSRKNLKNHQDGLVSIVIVTIIVSIMALITIGFSRIMDRELRQALDRELSSQASYAVKSGLNDARAYVNNVSKNGGDPSTNGCLDLSPTQIPKQFVRSISGSYTDPVNKNPTDNNVKYSCIIIDTNPRELIFNVNRGSSVVFKILPKQATPPNPPANIGSLFFSWENKSYPVDLTLIPPKIDPKPLPANPNNLPKEGDFNNAECGAYFSCTGMLRATIYPIPVDAGIPGDQNPLLASKSSTYYMYPNGAPSPAQQLRDIGQVNYNKSGVFVDGNCHPGNRVGNPQYLPYQRSTPRYCNSVVNDVNIAQGQFYYVRLTALYQTLSVSVQASDTSNATVLLGGSEAVIDVTGEGNNVLRRLQARTLLASQFSPGYSIQSLDSLCKRFRLPKIGPNSYDPAVIQDSANNSDQACAPVGAVPP